jgi:hypothetical protein
MVFYVAGKNYVDVGIYHPVTMKHILIGKKQLRSTENG